MNANKFSKIALTSSFLLVGSASIAFASGAYSNCDVVYGGGEVCPPNVSFTLDKLVQSPTKGGQFVDNLTVNDPMFNPNQDVTFQVKVKNTGDKKIDTLNIADTLPSALTYVGGGSYNAANKTVSIQVNNLEKDKEAVYFITTKVNDVKLLSNVNPECITNRVSAQDNTGNKAEDTANICISKPGVTMQPQIPTKNIPNTGPEALALVFLPPLGAAGLYLRRKAGL